ncbi:oocyte zinc finger protein XlCOF19-like [Penaeus indicus]|uniref:oocyte zinc finger protein XlCOF19-like n=1 Tax=Penaeus indicus TaxID=29960 RepID=UPI00300C3EB7
MIDDSVDIKEVEKVDKLSPNIKYKGTADSTKKCLVGPKKKHHVGYRGKDVLNVRKKAGLSKMGKEESLQIKGKLAAVNKDKLKTEKVVKDKEEFRADSQEDRSGGLASAVEGTKEIHVAGSKMERTFTCDICSKNFTRKENIVMHMRIHTGEKPYGCDKCEKKFPHIGDLIRHKRVHTGEKPYVCDVCGTGFSNISTCKRHHRIHTGEKPFTCDVCGKEFRHKSTLCKHMSIHTGEKKYECDICKKRFREKFYIAKHMRTHTKQ